MTSIVFSDLTTGRTLQWGRRVAQGTEGAYHRLEYGPGEPHVRRLELAGSPAAPAHRSSLLHFAFITDLHLLDAESPGRLEFADRFHSHEALRLLVPAYRPQEFLQAQACASMMATLSQVAAGPVTGAPPRFVLCGGDFVDNAQSNELRWALALFAGGTLTPGSGGPTYEGVSSAAWGDDAYWWPDPGADDYKTRWGFPTYPGLLEEARRPFEAPGVRLPWIACRGNHDALAQGSAGPTAALDHILVGARKARAFPGDVEPGRPGDDLTAQMRRFITRPETLLAGPATTVTPDADRRFYGGGEFVQAIAMAAGEPAGHGFTPRNLADGTGYYADDSYLPVRLVVLDTVNPGGGYQGSIGARQLAWLEQQLIDAHDRYWDAEGRLVVTGNTPRLVVIASHHGLASLTNDLIAVEGENDLPRVLGPELEAVLHRFPNVILWVNGHTHYHAVRPRPNPQGRSGGFWEVTTASMMGWPCQARLIELVDNRDGTLSAVCTMVDHAAPPDPASAGGLARLAAIHRELAANDPHAGAASGVRGQSSDRNVELVISAPFPLGVWP